MGQSKRKKKERRKSGELRESKTLKRGKSTLKNEKEGAPGQSFTNKVKRKIKDSALARETETLS